jgi:hypothetical protein
MGSIASILDSLALGDSTTLLGNVAAEASATGERPIPVGLLGVCSMVSGKRRPIHRLDCAIDGLRHAAAPILRDYARTGELRFAAITFRGNIQAAVQRGDPGRVIEIQVGKVYGRTVRVGVDDRRGCGRVGLGRRDHQGRRDMDQSTRYAGHHNLLVGSEEFGTQVLNDRMREPDSLR